MKNVWEQSKIELNSSDHVMYWFLFNRECHLRNSTANYTLCGLGYHLAQGKKSKIHGGNLGGTVRGTVQKYCSDTQFLL